MLVIPKGVVLSELIKGAAKKLPVRDGSRDFRRMQYKANLKAFKKGWQGATVEEKNQVITENLDYKHIKLNVRG